MRSGDQGGAGVSDERGSARTHCVQGAENQPRLRQWALSFKPALCGHGAALVEPPAVAVLPPHWWKSVLTGSWMAIF